MNELKNNAAGMTEVCPEMKHEGLYSAIIESESIHVRLEALLARIQGCESDENQPCDAKPPTSSLQDVLWNGAGNLRDQINMSHDAISKLEEILF